VRDCGVGALRRPGVVRPAIDEVSMSGDNTVVQIDRVQRALRQDFVRWQCEVRKNAARYVNGKPQEAMRPFVRLPGDAEARARITSVLVPEEPGTTVMEFRHMIRRTVDPVHRTDSALNKLSGTFYENPEKFSDRLTALFGPGVELADDLKRAQPVVLDFEQGGQFYSIPCEVEELGSDHPAYQATYWHNQLFNPEMPPGVRVLRFNPQWANASAEPMPT
jgi:hypothetical protein